jgi:DNA-binding NarL/FixJ family response regulator
MNRWRRAKISLFSTVVTLIRGHVPDSTVPMLPCCTARRGAEGFVSKDIALEELIAAIRAVAAGANWFQPALISSLRQALLRRRNGALARNCATVQSLQTAEGTVKNQVSSILAKMAVREEGACSQPC